MKTVLLEADLPGGQPRGYGTILVQLVAGSGGGALAGSVIGDTRKVKLDSAGEGSIDLDPNDSLLPSGSYYRLTVERSSPTLVRTIALTAATADPVAWTDPSIQVVEAPVGTNYVPSPEGAPDDYTLVTAGGQFVLGPAADGPGAVSYVHDQTTPSTTWTINHPLPFFPNVTLVTSGGDQFTVDQIHHAPGVVVATLLVAQGGKAYLS